MDGASRDDRAIKDQAARLAAAMFGLLRHFAVEDDQLIADLPLRQLRVCGILHGGPQSMSALSRNLDVSLSALTQIADRLERAQLVVREAAGSDRRVRRLRLTPRGESIMRRRETARAARIASVLATLPTAKRKEVLGAFETLVDACLNIERQDGRAAPAKAVV